MLRSAICLRSSASASSTVLVDDATVSPALAVSRISPVRCANPSLAWVTDSVVAANFIPNSSCSSAMLLYRSPEFAHGQFSPRQDRDLHRLHIVRPHAAEVTRAHLGRV